MVVVGLGEKCMLIFFCYLIFSCFKVFCEGWMILLSCCIDWLNLLLDMDVGYDVVLIVCYIWYGGLWIVVCGVCWFEIYNFWVVVWLSGCEEENVCLLGGYLKRWGKNILWNYV